MRFVPILVFVTAIWPRFLNFLNSLWDGWFRTITLIVTWLSASFGFALLPDLVYRIQFKYGAISQIPDEFMMSHIRGILLAIALIAIPFSWGAWKEMRYNHGRMEEDLTTYTALKKARGTNHEA